MRLIDADKLKEHFPKDEDWDYPVNTNSEVVGIIDDAPTVDPIKHGRWIVNDNPHTCRCSCCESVELVDWALEQAKYCPHCGAKMDGERREDELLN